MTEMTNLPIGLIEAPMYLADRIAQMKAGETSNVGDIAGGILWDHYSPNERTVLDRYVSELIKEQLLPLEYVGFDGEGQNVYRKRDV
jgi:hypothetical protein